MLFEKLFNQTASPVLEEMLRFTAARHKLIADNVVNISTPGYQQKDLDLAKFEKMLGDRIEQRDAAAPGSVGFSDMELPQDDKQHGILFHDGQARSMEQLMSDQAKNAMMHNLAIELLRKQYQTMELSLKDRPT